MPPHAGKGRLLCAHFLAAFLALAFAGCSWMLQGSAPPETGEGPPADNAARAAVAEVIPPAIPIPDAPAPAPEPVAPPQEPAVVRLPLPVEEAKPAEAPGDTEPSLSPPAPVPEASKGAKGAQETPAGRKPVPGVPPAPPSHAPPSAHAPAPPPALPPSARTEEPPPPAWAAQKELLEYRVDFIGITMGYAWFRYQGKVSIGGRTAYHLNVRARTSGVLSLIYPVSESIDYYIDAATLEPIRLEFRGRKNKPDDVAQYDQEKGRITYRYLHNGEIRKQVDVLPGTHDPVSAAYYFRGRGFGKEEKERNVYGGRKVYQISPRTVGTERLHTERGDFDTLVVQPVIKRDGKVENKGDLRMWVTRDERRLPVRFYAKFRKIKEWTLVGILMNERSGG
ncbi:MAG: DUF3108 domain-containing protein [Thermodesulfobacteriota bacterium]